MNDFFDKIYVLSLRKEVERRKKLKYRLDYVDIEFEFFDAIDGSLLNSLWKNVNHHFFTTPNYLACQLSHLSIYKDAINNNYQRILILEDDAIPLKNINLVFDSIKYQIPDYDILYLGYIPLDDACQCWDYTVISDRFISENIFDSRNLWGLYAYSISNSMMKEMLSVYNNEIPMEIDRYYVSHHKKYFGTLPQLFCHDVNVSGNAGLLDQSSLRKSIHYLYSTDDYLI